jgi:hypothetical protein
MQLLGAADENNTDIATLAPTVAEVCMKEEFEICRDEHVLPRILPAWLGIERQNQLLGNNTPDAFNTERYVKACLKFELDFFSTAGGTTDSYDHDEGVQALKTRCSGTAAASPAVPPCSRCTTTCATSSAAAASAAACT